MKSKTVWYTLGGLAAINAAAMYGLFRLVTSYQSLLEGESWLGYAIICIFFLSEIFVVVNAIGYFINILSAAYVYERPPVKSLNGRRAPRVIAFIPIKNERIDLLARTFAACSMLRYPHLTVVAVDSSDAASHQAKVRASAHSFGIEYFLNALPRHGAKAGALNKAMAAYEAPYYAVFDSDYHPTRDFLRVLVPQMEADAKLAYIQTPQFYGNLVQSPVSRIAQIQQSIFYEYIAEGKSVHNSMFMCGTNLLIRGEAIRSIGGWDETSVTEDFSSSILLSKLGWKSRYDSRILAFGLGPINLDGYLNQQSRWARGTFGAFFKNASTFLNPWSPLAFFQKLEYVLSGLYFLIGVVWFVLVCMPVVYIYFRIPAYTADPFLFTIAYLPYFVMSFLFFGGTMRYRRFRIRDLLRAQSLTLMTLPVYIRAFIAACFGQPTPFVATSKDGSPFDIPWHRLSIQLGLIFANVSAVLFGLLTYEWSSNKPALLTNIVWAAFHAAILLYFIWYLYAAERKDAARGARRTIPRSHGASHSPHV